MRRFGLLAGDLASNKDVSVEQILSVNELDVASYRIGPSQVSDTNYFEHLYVI